MDENEEDHADDDDLENEDFDSNNDNKVMDLVTRKSASPKDTSRDCRQSNIFLFSSNKFCF